MRRRLKGESCPWVSPPLAAGGGEADGVSQAYRQAEEGGYGHGSIGRGALSDWLSLRLGRSHPCGKPFEGCFTAPSSTGKLQL